METSVDSISGHNDIELVSMAAIEDEAEKRAHHNALERKRRDHIKDSFYCLRDSVPQLRGEKASRALILNKATDYIKSLKGKNMCHKKEIDDIKKQNDVLEQEIDKIIKLNNSLGKDRIELIGEEFVKVSDNSNSNDASNTSTTPQSTPPTFTRITEKDRGPCIGKRELDGSEENIETTGDEQPTVMKITKPIEKSENVPDNKVDTRNPPRVNIGSVKQQTAKISFAQAGGVTKNGTGTIQIPASALAKALPNGFKNVTAIYKQTGNNKPIRLQIITHNGSSTTAGALFAVRNNSPKKNAENTSEKEKTDEDKNSNIVKNLGDININSSKSEEQNNGTKPKETEKESKTTENGNKKDESASPEKKQMSDGPRTPQNQPLYARHRILHASPSKEKKQVKAKEKPSEKPSETSEFDSYKTQHSIHGNVSERSVNSPRTPGQVQTLQRDPSAIATISESELAFLTRPSTTTAGKEDGTATGDRNSSSKERGRAGKIEHGNIPILYKGSLLSDRDKEIDDEREPQKLVLYSARAMDGSRPFACHICGKSFNMLSSLKVHEHIHVPVKKKPYPCDLCHRSFMTLRILSQHKESHYGRISTFHRQSSLGKKSQVSFATHPQMVQNRNAASEKRSPRTSITNIFHVRASSPNDTPLEKKYSTITITPSKGTVAVSNKGVTKSSSQRILPTTRVRQGQVIVQARPGAGATAYKVRTKAECEEARNFGLKVVPFKRSSSLADFGEKKIKVEDSNNI